MRRAPPDGEGYSQEDETEAQKGIIVNSGRRVQLQINVKTEAQDKHARCPAKLFFLVPLSFPPTRPLQVYIVAVWLLLGPSTLQRRQQRTKPTQKLPTRQFIVRFPSHRRMGKVLNESLLNKKMKILQLKQFFFLPILDVIIHAKIDIILKKNIIHKPLFLYIKYILQVGSKGRGGHNHVTFFFSLSFTEVIGFLNLFYNMFYILILQNTLIYSCQSFISNFVIV